MRHQIEIPTIINPKQRVPELTVKIKQEKLRNFIKDNNSKLCDLLNIYNLSKEGLIEHVSHELLVSLNGYSTKHQREQMAMEVADKMWTQHFKPQLIDVVFDDMVDQAISYTHNKHIQEISYEESEESRKRLVHLVSDSLTKDRILGHPVQISFESKYQVMPEDLQPYLDRLYTETVRDIYTTIHTLEQPLEETLYKSFFNDTSPTKFTLDMLERFHKGEYLTDEIISWALVNKDFFMQEILSNCTRNIDRDPNISQEEKLTQKAASYQLLKNIFLTQKEVE